MSPLAGNTDISEAKHRYSSASEAQVALPEAFITKRVVSSVVFFFLIAQSI